MSGTISENHQALVARMLAKENITVIYGNFSTAAFEPENRILRLPIWSKTSRDVGDAFVGHEVGHALFTSKDLMDRYKKEFNHIPFSIVNIIEDIRIERLIQNRYPGLISIFRRSYDEILRLGKFGDISDLKFIDRLNVHAKAGHAAPQEFSSEEIPMVDLAYSCKSEDDVLSAAEKIHEFIKSRKPKTPKGDDKESKSSDNKQKPQEKDDSEDFDSDAGDESDTESETDDSDEKCACHDDETVSETQETLDQFKEDSVQSASSISNIPRIDRLFKEVRRDIKIDTSRKTSFGEFRKSVSFDVSQLVCQFNRRKKASEYAKRRVSVSGDLDMNRLHEYTFAEDIFRSIEVVKEGKNHALVIFLDMSGSMQGIFKRVIEKALILVFFCKKLSIPYSLYTFTSDYAPGVERKSEIFDLRDTLIVERVTSFSKHEKDLLETLYGMSNHTNSDAWSYSRFGGTPLSKSLLVAKSALDGMKSRSKREVVSGVIISDGDGDTLKMDSLIIGNDTLKMNGNAVFQQKNIVEYIRSKGYRMIGIYLSMDSSALRYICGNINHHRENYSDRIPVDAVISEYEKRKCVSFSDALGYDSYIVVDSNYVVSSEDFRQNLTIKKSKTLFAEAFAQTIS